MSGEPKTIQSDEVTAGPAAIATAGSALLSIDARVFGGVPRVSLGRQLADVRLAVARFLGETPLPATRMSGDRPWNLSALAAEDTFQRIYDGTATAIADLFTLKIHLNIAQLRAGFAVFVESFGRPGPALDYRNFVDAVGRLIASCGQRRIVTYSAMIRDRTNMIFPVVLDYPSEVTALVLGEALYATQVRRLTGEDPSAATTPLVLENAAALLRRQPAAAQKFRELLQLATPWT